MKPEILAIERSIVGTLIAEFPQVVPDHIARMIEAAPQSFQDPMLGRLAAVVRTLQASNTPIHIGAIRDYLASNNLTKQIPPSTLASLSFEASVIDLVEYDAQKLWEDYSNRQAQSVMLEAAEELKGNPAATKAVISSAKQALDSVATETFSKKLAQRRFDPARRPGELVGIYTMGGKIISTAGNLTTITSAIKTGKSATIGAMMASTMPFPDPEKVDCLGFASGNPNGLAVVHIDSEQSPDDHWHQISRVLRRATITEPPAWFYSYCLTGSDALTAWKLARAAIALAARECRGVHSIFIDGVADMVPDVNDPATCNAFVAELHDLAIQHRCAIIGVIHFNPNSDKSRGHLGSQLERKAETNLRLDKNNEVTTIWSERQRRSPFPKGTGPSFEWSDDHGMHVSRESSAPVSRGTRDGRPNAITRIATMNTHSFLAQCLAGGEGKNQIAARLEIWLAGEKIDASIATCKRAIGVMVENGKLAKSSLTGLYIKGPNA